MRAAVFHKAGQPLSIETVADPRPAAGEVVLQVARAGICGSDLHMVNAGFNLPSTSATTVRPATAATTPCARR